MARYPRTILVSCPVPWDADEQLIEDLFRLAVRQTLAAGFTDVYIFGTGGEGYAVDEARFRQVATVFRAETNHPGVRPMVGVISLSMATIVERIAFCMELGFRTFQLSLPSWGALNDDEIVAFFEGVCGRFPEASFLHYNLGRSKRILRAADYVRLIERIPNLVATKSTQSEIAHCEALVTVAGELRHFMDVNNYAYGARVGAPGLLASYAHLSPLRCRALFEAGRERDLLALFDLHLGFARLGEALWRVPSPAPHMDGAYDKMLTRVGLLAEFPLRLLAPYRGYDEEDYRACRALMEGRFPDWLAPPAAEGGLG